MRIARLFEEEGAREQGREIERIERQRAIDCAKRARCIAPRAPHRRKLGP